MGDNRFTNYGEAVRLAEVDRLEEEDRAGWFCDTCHKQGLDCDTADEASRQTREHIQENHSHSVRQGYWMGKELVDGQ